MFKLPGEDEHAGTKILLEAMSKDQVHLARFVLDALDGGIVDSRTESAQTPLISSILLPGGQTRCKFMELLLQRGANVNDRDADGRTALSYACERGYLDAVKVLVRNNADPELVDAWGNTALMYAAVAGQSPVVEFLVRAFKRLGLQVNRQNQAGNSAVEVAKFLGHTECFSALTNSRKSHEVWGGGGGDSLEQKVEHVANQLEHILACDDVGSCSSSRRARPRVSHHPSMDSIEKELDRENDHPPSPPEVVFSWVLTPKPSPRVDRAPKAGGKLLIPPLNQSCEPHKSGFFSPRAGRNPPAPSPLDILLTPILGRKSEKETEKCKMSDFRRCHDSFYQKRCSLPNGVFCPAAQVRAPVPPRKSKTVRRRAASPSSKKEHPQRPVASSATFSALGNKLLRRFTSPEFRKEKEPDPVVTSGRIPRSETFPQSRKHPQVDCKASVDSISSVTCEFDFRVSDRVTRKKFATPPEM